MNLYRIIVRHYAPKDSTAATVCFLFAENDEQVYEWLKTEPEVFGERYFNSWGDDEGEGEVHDGLPFKDSIIKSKGDLHNDYIELEDLYYGQDLYAWELYIEDVGREWTLNEFAPDFFFYASNNQEP